MTGPANYQREASSILRGYGIPARYAAIYEHTHDTGYPGLIIRCTKVDLHIQDTDLEKKVTSSLQLIGFR